MTFQETDIQILRLIQHHRIVALDHALYLVSFLTTYIDLAILIAILIASFVKKSRQLRIIFFKMLIVLLLAALTSFALKSLVMRQRPYQVYPDIEKLSEGGSSSFPSGHTLEVFAVAVALSRLIRKKQIVPAVFAWAFLVAYSRMALGVHYPSDVLAGAITGSVIGYLVPDLITFKSEVRSG